MINHTIIELVEIFARALSRFFTLGDFKDFGMFLSTKTHHFLFLREDQLVDCTYLEKKY